MFLRLLTFLLIFVQFESHGQTDSLFNVMILKKGIQPEIKDNMAEYNPTGFYLYRNCFYDLKFKDKTKKTLRLIDIKPDSLIFIGISNKLDSNLTEISNDTLIVNYLSIDKILLLKDWSSGASKKINCDDHYFIFFKSSTNNRYESNFDYVFSSRTEKNELVPRLSYRGITFHYEYGGNLYYHSGIKVQTPKYTNQEKAKALNAAMTVLNLIVNKKINVTIQNTKREKNK